MESEIKIRINRELNVVTYAEHWHTAKCLLQKAKQDKDGSYHQELACITFIAFTLESFLNQMGEELFGTWIDLEQLNVRGKINVIAEKLGVNVDYGKMPWQIVPELVAIRNKVAHGKNERLFEEIVIPESEYDRTLKGFLKTSWQKAVSSQNADKFIEEVESVCKIIWTSAGHNNATLFTFGIQSGSAKRDD